MGVNRSPSGVWKHPRVKKIKGVNSWCWGVKTIAGCGAQLKLRVIYELCNQSNDSGLCVIIDR